MNYQAALDYVLSFADYERASRSAVVFDLRRMEMLLARLGSPQAGAVAVQVAGTKGKGSTAAMIASILTGAGYKTGLYTSPHLHSFTERIGVDGVPIAEDEFARLVEAMKPEVEAVNEFGAFGELTTFELLTALAFAYFKGRGVAFQVLETGLGGRLDATNVVKPGISRHYLYKLRPYRGSGRYPYPDSHREGGYYQAGGHCRLLPPVPRGNGGDRGGVPGAGGKAGQGRQRCHLAPGSL